MGLKNYENSVERDYKDEIHPFLVRSLASSSARHAGAMVVEIGAGTGDLAMAVFKSLTQQGKEAHVIGLELLPGNVAIATQAAASLTIPEGSSLVFSACDSVTLLESLDPKIGDHINDCLERFHAKHGQNLPIYVVASGALNRLVLDGFHDSSRVLQHIHRLNPTCMMVSGVTDTLLTPHVIHASGFETAIQRRLFIDTQSTYHGLKPKPLADQASYHLDKWRSDPTTLDLSLSPNPLALIQALPAEKLADIRTLDASYALFLGHEAARFLAFVHKACPRLEQLVYRYGCNRDAMTMTDAIRKLESSLADAPAFLAKLKGSPATEDWHLAFSPHFIQRLLKSP